jgi:WD40 repeat protein
MGCTFLRLAMMGVCIWDSVRGGDGSKALVGHLSGIRAITLAPDGLKLYVVDFFGNAYIWDIQTLKVVVASMRLQRVWLG